MYDQKRGENREQYDGSICPLGFGKQLQGMALCGKKAHKTDLLTEYDSPPSYGKPSIVDKILDGVQFNLGMEATSPVVIYDKDDGTYKKLQQERVEWLEAFCKTEHCVQTNNHVLKKATTDTRDRIIEQDAAEDDDIIVLKERAKKKRKLTKGLREFTGESAQGEKNTKDGRMKEW